MLWRTDFPNIRKFTANDIMFSLGKYKLLQVQKFIVSIFMVKVEKDLTLWT